MKTVRRTSLKVAASTVFVLVGLAGRGHAQTAAPGGLADVVVVAKAKCVVNPDSSVAGVGRVWAVAKASLMAITQTERASALTMDFDLFERTYDAKGKKPLSESVSKREAVHTRPVTNATPAALHEVGYARVEGPAVTYFAPSAPILISPEFASSYCLKLREPEPRDSADGSVGLLFSPIDEKRPQTDIDGVIWVDRTTGDVRRIDYRYVRLPGGLDAPTAGGRLIFRTLPDHRSLTLSWAMRLPISGIMTSGGRGDIDRYSNSASQHAEQAVQKVVVTGFQELGGTITRVLQADGTSWMP